MSGGTTVRIDSSSTITSGVAGNLPYLAIGTGKPVVILPGLLPDAGVESNMVARVGLFYSKLVTGRRVLLFNRRPGLPPGMTMGQLAAEQADAIRAAFDGPVDVIGLSTGGSIAADHPDTVRRLVLISTACRLGEDGRALQHEVAALVRQGKNRRALAMLIAGLVPRYRGRLAAGALGWAIARRVLPDGHALADLATTIEAEEDFDLARCPPILAPTLILAGGKDRLYGRSGVSRASGRWSS